MAATAPRSDPAAPARKLLTSLLRRAELAALSGRSVGGQRWEEADLPAPVLDPCRRLLEQAHEARAVSLDRLSGFRAGTIRTVRLLDADALARFVGEERWGEKLPLLEDAIAPSLAGAPGWLAAIGERCRARWARNDAPFGLKPDDPLAAGEAFRLLRGVADEGHRGLDLRTFSLNVAGCTKALEERRGAVAAALRTAFSLGEGMSADDVLRTFGLERFQQALLVRAPLRLPGMRGAITAMRPYVGVPPELVRSLEPVGRSPYLLIIENLTTFNRYVREVEDDGLVLYAGGFPSRLCRTAAARLAQASDMAAHWGDVDPGGVRIFSVLEQAVPNLLPHLMTEALARDHGFETDGDPALAALAASGSAVAGLAAFLSQERTWRLEQEALTPVAPSASGRVGPERHADPGSQCRA